MTDEESKKKIFQVPDFIGFACRQLGMWRIMHGLYLVINTQSLPNVNYLQKKKQRICFKYLFEVSL